MTSKRRPNVLIVMSDQHNAHVMGCAGDSIVRTPNLDSLAARGTMFSNAYCPHPLCVPSRMGFMAAQPPGDIDVWSNRSVLSTNVPTFAHAFGRGGYEAVICGRMHFVGEDQFHGFERRIRGDCMDVGGGKAFIHGDVLGEGQNRTTGQIRYAVEVAGHGHNGYQSYDRMVTDGACEFFNERTSDDRPFCLVVGYMLPHNPLICDKDRFDYYLDRLPVPEPLSADELAALNPAIRMWRERRRVDKLSPEQHHRALAAYYGLVEEMDANLGRVLDALESSGLMDDTVVVYTSDHGDMAAERGGMWWKSSFYEGSARVPLIIANPSRGAAGKSVDALVNLIDVGPTALDLAGCEPLPDVASRSLVGFLGEGEGPVDWPNEVFSEFLGAHGDQPSCMLREGPWKLMYYSEFDSCLLFNLEDDPAERYDLANDPAQAERRERMLAKIHDRWSAERMLEGERRTRAAKELIESCGHGFFSHSFEPEGPPENANQFDFDQLPDWESIRRRVERKET